MKRISPTLRRQAGALRRCAVESLEAMWVTAAAALTGEGQTVVVIDSGIAYDHGALGGGLGANFRVVGGWDFAESDADPYDDGPMGSHGTHVAGIIASTDAAMAGVASGVDLVALRVFDDDGNSNLDWIEQALRWVHTNRLAFDNPITTVNLSIGIRPGSATAPSWTVIDDELAALEADGVFIAVAAGNAFSQTNGAALNYPAASPHVVPVMSVDADGQLSSFSQRHDRALAAPGRSIRSTVPDYAGNFNYRADDFARYTGTSMAAPYVAGASVLVRQALQSAGHAGVNQDAIETILRSTADTVFDSLTGHNYLRINLARALDSIPSANTTTARPDTETPSVPTDPDPDPDPPQARTGGAVRMAASREHNLRDGRRVPDSHASTRVAGSRTTTRLSERSAGRARRTNTNFDRYVAGFDAVYAQMERSTGDIGVVDYVYAQVGRKIDPIVSS
jgi:subtilisin family serine protease